LRACSPSDDAIEFVRNRRLNPVDHSAGRIERLGAMEMALGIDK
jgi:hypothetical protein